ncbi:nitrophenyl compound nitroreductase subunit ArsF family protein [Prolixibacter sp. SD074]|jgi:hypothetical protein|uniref:nitrophenyl compound nitroreductase subunit ArsF family protein n=1 Tax=Prolixibacter sp. SD074 TaxID=2652391 RepID=UPI001271C781|nr:nitrophenyl compound nitroreductase subunit ArsF family protein [Prolixibacter sp. SD074]GET29074.1 hypothetical protein SD074_12760 [Prolixibacter sp. SD074]
MKNYFLISIIALAVFTACKPGHQKEAQRKAAMETDTIISIPPHTVNVYYFHGDKPCTTCQAVGNVAKETVMKYFADSMNVHFIDININRKPNRKLTRYYHVTNTSIVVAGREGYDNLTKEAFDYAVKKPDKLEIIIKETIMQREEYNR